MHVDLEILVPMGRILSPEGKIILQSMDNETGYFGLSSHQINIEE